jgi:hypothetical protein
MPKHSNGSLESMPQLSPTRPEEHDEARRRERRSQLRGLLVLAALVLLWILYRADRHALFHAGWWRP